jgi:hypothetical protein
MRVALAIVAAMILGLAPGALAGAGGGVSFRNDVMGVISKAGCNAGACHGNKSGKAGFKLSLRGQDCEADYAVLTREYSGRRVDLFDPDQSMILLKPTTQLPHEGGHRFSTDSLEYRILREWIAGGAQFDAADKPRLLKLEVSPSERVLVEPARTMKISAVAVFSDGSRRDVSRLAVYEQANVLATISLDGEVTGNRKGETTVIVRYLQLQQPVRLTFVPARPDFVWSNPTTANVIDEQVFAKLRSIRVNPSLPCTDAEFLRRAYLDLLGIPPTPEEARAFLTDSRGNKRSRLVDDLLERPEYADFWTLKWADLLRMEERALDKKGTQAFHRWIRESIAQNKPLDQFARELVSARGSTYANPPANYYRPDRDAVSRAEAAAAIFLGTQLKCAQCHNHPFDRWTQDDYYSWASVFGRVDYKVLENHRRDTNDSHEFIGEQVVFLSDQNTLTDPRTGKTPPPRFLGEVKADHGGDPLRDLAAWMTRPQNPFFALAQVNRIWYHLMGRGIVDPVDDFRATNPPSHPALLDALTKDFVEHGYDAKRLIRLIMNSRTYALSSQPNATNAEDAINYSHVVPRRLGAEQALDAQYLACGVEPKLNGYPVGMRATQVPAPPSGRGAKSAGDAFLGVFGKPPRLLSCECERSAEPTMPQAFWMISGPEISRLISTPENRIGRIIASKMSTAQAVEELYLAALSRFPTPEESTSMCSYVDRAHDRRSALEDVLWAFLNAKEFILRK